MIKSEIITIGSELLQGRTLNTNSQYLSRELTTLNFHVLHHQTCDDDAVEIVQALDLAFSRSDLIIATGGLGPTPDDITRKVVSDYFKSKLIFNAKQYQYIQRFFKKIGKKPSPITKSECFFPEIGTPILNQFGIALGFHISRQSKLLVCLPGVPRELVNLYKSSVSRIIQRHFKLRAKTYELNVSLMGIDEAKAMRIFGKSFFENSKFVFGSYPMDGRLVFRFRASRSSMLSEVKRVLKRKFSRYIYSFDDISLEMVIAQSALQKRRTIAIAESCTGGLISKRLTDIAGASRFILGSVIAYSNQVKIDCLGVSERLLQVCGAVSREVAVQMARGVRAQLKADLAISVTGIAGPSGATPKKPVGLVWIGISTSRFNRAYRFCFVGTRDRVRRLAADHALRILQQNL